MLTYIDSVLRSDAFPIDAIFDRLGCKLPCGFACHLEVCWKIDNKI
jgi:hypothetical protein